MQLEIGIFVKIPKIKDTNVVELELRLRISALRNRFLIFVTFTAGILLKYEIKINAYGVREIVNDLSKLMISSRYTISCMDYTGDIIRWFRGIADPRKWSKIVSRILNLR